MSSLFNPNYFQAILNLIQGRHSTVATVWGMFWQAFYALAGCVIGAAVFGNIGALIGTVLGAWFGFRSVNPYHSLVGQLSNLSDHHKQNIADEIRRTVGSSSVDNLVRYATNGTSRQFIFDIIQRYMNNQQPDAHDRHHNRHNANPGFFSSLFS